MVELNKELLEFIAEDINSENKKQLRKQDFDRWMMFNGKTQEIIKDAIKKEFKRPETVEELIGRLVPLNITQKVINKLAGVYTEQPLREVEDQNESDQELVELYEDGMELDLIQKEANRYFKIYKRNLQEIFVDDYGIPSVRNLPRHTYEVYSFNSKKRNHPDLIAIIKNDDIDRKEQVIAIWTDKQHAIINGNGTVLFDKMIELDNADLINPFGAMPFVYNNESTYSVDPLSDDDLLRMAIAIPVVLTDLLFACKYQCWSIIYTIGDVGDLPSNPSSVIAMDYGPDGQKPEVGTIKPEIDIVAILQLVTNLISTLLTTKNLSAGTIKTTQSVQETISGISKVLDNAESVEDKKDQQAFFAKAESKLWYLLSKHMIPVWRKQNILHSDFNREFSPAFGVSVLFREPKVMLSEAEQIKNSADKLKYGFSTLRRELSALNPDMSDQQIEDLAQEIEEEKRNQSQTQVDSINGEEIQSDVPDQLA